MNAQSRIAPCVEALLLLYARLRGLEPRPAPVYVPVAIRRPTTVRIPVERR